MSGMTKRQGRSGRCHGKGAGAKGYAARTGERNKRVYDGWKGRTVLSGKGLDSK